MTDDNIRVFDAHENNLKHIDVTIPKGKLVVFAGVSGSGKSSLAFDTLAVESSREWQASYPLYVRNKMPHYERPAAGRIENLTPAIVIDQKRYGTGGRSTVGSAVDAAPLLRLMFSRIGEPSAGGSMAYNPAHPAGMCPHCSGLGEVMELDGTKLFDTSKSLREGALLFSQFAAGWQSDLYLTNSFLDPDKRLSDYSDEEWKLLKYGPEETAKIEIRSNKTGRVDTVAYEGVLPRFQRLYLRRDISKLKQALQDEILSKVTKQPCGDCRGTGLNPAALASKIDVFNIMDMLAMPVGDLLPVLEKINNPVGQSIVRQLTEKLAMMVRVGIGYLTLARGTDTLSGGELQRLKLVRNLGSSLSNLTYIFDEPTAGLHPADAEKIGSILSELRDKHNNVLVVEHSPQMLEIADHIIEMGPLAGEHGGEIVFEGTVDGMKKADTLTGRMLRERIKLNSSPRIWQESYNIKDACLHNLKHVSVAIPKGVLTAVTGVAGSGKSSLITGELAARYPEAVVIDQKPIGTSIRSTPATYTGIMDEIRKIFGKANGTAPSLFSFNSKGACPVCRGTGKIVFDMAFADAVEVVCEECGGHRYNPQALSYTYRGRNIEEVMRLTIEEAMDFFDNRKIRAALQGLVDVGLGYMTLGQPTSTLSGGEVQRVKLAAELNKSGNLYILDEPSTGLHHQDVLKLLELLYRLVDEGNTVVIVEHRLELIAQADYVIDMGPEGGSRGGEVLFTGPPEELLQCRTSRTAEYLRNSI